MTYSWRHPNSIHRSVMIAVNPPGHFLWDAKSTDEQIRRYSAPARRDESCRSRTDDLAASIRQTTTNIPDRWLFLPVKQGNVADRLLLRTDGIDLGGGAALRADNAELLDLGRRRRCERVLVPVAARRPRLPDIIRLGRRGSHREVRRPRREALLLIRPASASRDPGTDFIWGGGQLVKAWPASADEDEYGQVRTSNVETLLIGGALDFATPPQIATKELLPYLPNGHQVVLPGFGHSTSFWTDQPKAGSRLINSFLDRGQVDDSLYKPMSVDFTPEVTVTALAKGIAGGMVGLALLAIALAAVDGTQGAQARILRTQSRRDPTVAVSDRPRPRRLVPRRS